MSLFTMTAHELKDKLLSREISAMELLDSVYGQIEGVEPQVQAYITLTKELAQEQAKAVDEGFQRGSAQAGAGIPIAIKDNISVAGVPNTCASKMLANYRPPFHATVVEKLIAAGMPILGKTNMDEFATGSSSESSWYHPTRNPWDLARVPGGSSGGSAAAVSAGEAIWALGTDTGGSLRQPAAFCGVVALKPTYGLISRYGVVAVASSLDHVGPVTKDVTDCALLLQRIAGYDGRDSTSAQEEIPDYASYLQTNIRGLRVGVPKEFLSLDGLDGEVRQGVERAIKLYEELGAAIIEVTLPHIHQALSVYYIIMSAEASSNLGRYDGVRYGYRCEDAGDTVSMFSQTRSEGFGPEVKRRILVGTYLLSSGQYETYYRQAQRVRTLIARDFQQAFAQCDVILGPTVPTTAFELGARRDDPLEMYQSDIYTAPVNLAGLPAMSVPCGLDSSGLPMGLQLIGPHFGEGTLLKAAYAYEQASGHYRLRAPVEVKNNG